MRTQNIARLAATGQATEVKRVFTRDEIFDIAIVGARRNRNVPLANPQMIEFTPRFLLWFRSTNFTSLAPVVQALQEAGVDVKPNLGSLRRVLGVSPQTLHEICCGCHGSTSTGEDIAWALTDVRDLGA